MNSVGLNDMLPVALGEWFATWWWVIAVVLGLSILKQVAAKRRPRQRRRARRDYSGRTGRSPTEAPKSDASRLGDPKAQMEFISRVDFEPCRLLNKSEYGILQILERFTREIGGGYRVMAQTSLGEIIAPSTASGSEEARDLASRSINSKRLDFLVIDRFGMPALAVEYQGHGHYQNTAFMRDAVKREAVRKARGPVPGDSGGVRRNGPGEPNSLSVAPGPKTRFRLTAGSCELHSRILRQARRIFRANKEKDALQMVSNSPGVPLEVRDAARLKVRQLR